MDQPTISLLAEAANEVWTNIERTIDLLGEDDWGRPTPCVGWDVRDVLSHLGHAEGLLVHGFPQPEPPSESVATGSPLDQMTNQGVAARRSWPFTQVVDEVRRAADATRTLLTGPDLDWEAPCMTPVGPSPRRLATELRVTDLVVHLIDIRTALGLPLDQGEESSAVAVAVGRAVRLTPWAWVKRARAAEGQSLQLGLTGPGAGTHTVVVNEGRAVAGSADDSPDASIRGAGLAYLLAVTGRHGLVAAGGGLVTRGELARVLLESYRLVG
ncbi:MAG: maleylpyruvate isomerase family mycothiol-dependent enzyme [Acidimicrobiia bacterium]|nr:maleylpyruvate isomerase family mycothiol-dependent enzyme [Acidimicrobiia bacterium]